MRKVLDLMIFFVIMCGIRKIVINKLDVVMLIIRSIIEFFVFKNVVMRKVFLSKVISRVRICIIIVICFGFIGVLLLV